MFTSILKIPWDHFVSALPHVSEVMKHSVLWLRVWFEKVGRQNIVLTPHKDVYVLIPGT